MLWGLVWVCLFVGKMVGGAGLLVGGAIVEGTCGFGLVGFIYYLFICLFFVLLVILLCLYFVYFIG